ncbi:MAG: Rpn family recombination-promoting nuclease/putative transposase, partial [Blastocatellia bacterium]
MSTLDHLNSWTKKTFSDVTFGERREVDLVAKLKFENRDAFFLIHVENQAQVQPEFGNRMHTYFARLHEKHALPVYPIAVFTYDSPRTEQPDIYRIEFPDRVVLDFRYRVVQLNRLNWRDFAKRENPVASALMAKMNIAPTDRPRVKLECIRLLAGLRLNKAKMQVILGFVDTYLRLDEKETGTYELELEKLAPAEKETMMEVTMSWREQALQEGLQ